MRNLKSILILTTVGFILVGVVFSSVFLIYANQPAGKTRQEVTINIEPGMSLTQVANLLASKRIIGNPTTFRIYTYLKGRQSNIQAGEYLLSPSYKPEEILKKLTAGVTVEHTVTIPEGYRLTEIADLMATAGLANRKRFIEAARDPALVAEFNIPTEDLEGYLFPDTYQFRRQAGEKHIIRTMLDTFRKRAFSAENQSRAKKLGFSFHQVVTLASLIEKETGLETERQLISSVFHNRLGRKMLLQTDPTVIYAIKDFDGNIRKKDLSIDSPYNTYRYPGLPPGPIASPGLDSILAALNPAESEALYFVSKQDGSHQFSNNLIDHNQAVMKYQIRRNKNKSFLIIMLNNYLFFK